MDKYTDKQLYRFIQQRDVDDIRLLDQLDALKALKMAYMNGASMMVCPLCQLHNNMHGDTSCEYCVWYLECGEHIHCTQWLKEIDLSVFRCYAKARKHKMVVMRLKQLDKQIDAVQRMMKMLEQTTGHYNSTKWKPLLYVHKRINDRAESFAAGYELRMSRCDWPTAYPLYRLQRNAVKAGRYRYNMER